MQKNVFDKQWNDLIKQEGRFLIRQQEKKTFKYEETIADKVPEKLKTTLDATFIKSFTLIFEKGVPIIEKSYKKKELEYRYKLNEYAFTLKQDKKRIREFEKGVMKSTSKNVLASGMKGVGLGFFGIGLPDIPIFIGVLLKGIYEIALQYGYCYDTQEERYFILNIIATSLSYGERMRAGNRELNRFIETQKLPETYVQSAQVKNVSNVLSTELLCMKFVQGVPIVGAVGGVTDAVLVKKVFSYAKLKYKRRFLQDKKAGCLVRGNE